MKHKAIPWNPETVPLSKSLVQMYEQCPKRFEMQVIKRVPYTKTPELQRGTDVHKRIAHLLNNVQRWKIKTADDVQREFAALLPDEIVYRNYIEIETERFERLFSQNLQHLFWPILVEHYMEDFELMYSGTLDRLDVLENGDLIVIDWKTGNYHEWSKSDYRFELIGYKHLVEKTKVFPGTVTHGAIVFLDEKRVFVEEFDYRSINAFYRKVKRVRQKIKDKQFEQKITPMCDYCPYVGTCLTTQGFAQATE